MSAVQEATDALRTALRERNVESHVQDAFDNLASCLVLLNSSYPSVAMIRKLCTVFRQPFLPLYNSCLQRALQLSSSVLSAVLGKLCDAHNAGDDKLRAAWDTTAEVILSGILDFLDQKDEVNVESDGGGGEVLCRIICEFFFLDSGRGFPAFSVPLCLSAYNTLTEIAARQITIRTALRQRTVLGGERLGAVISGTRDYLLLEALLMLFARLLPPTHNTSQGKLRRAKFVKEALGSPKLFRCSAALLDIMQNTSDIHWDNVAAQIIDVLARSDVTYPQPFAIDEIHVCGRVFPQPLATDMLIMDRYAFLVDIVVENDDPRESLQVPYSHIRTITVDNSEKNVPKGVLITVYLASPPLVANVEMKPHDTSHLHAKFMLQNEALGRFMEALRRRGVGKLSFLNPQARVERKRKSVSIGSGFKFTNDSSPISPTASFEGKVKHVHQVYKTDTVPLLTSDRKLPSNDENLVSEVLEPSEVEVTRTALKDTRPLSPINETPKLVWNSIRTTHGLGDSDQLSEISEFAVDDNITDGRAATKASASCDDGQQEKDRMRMKVDSSATSEGGRWPFHLASKSADCTGVAHLSPGTKKPWSTLDSPMFGASSVTQIDVSPKLLSNTDTLLPVIGAEFIDNLPLAPQAFIGADPPKSLDVNEYACPNTELITPSSGKSPKELDSERDGLGQQAECFISTSGANQEVHSRAMKDTTVLPQFAGSRRKRESIKASSKSAIEVDEEHIPPRKKSRGNMLEIHEDKAKSSLDAVPASKAKRCMKTSKHTSPGIGLTTDDVEELTELEFTSWDTRRSSRIKKKQMAATGGTRSNVKRGKTQKKQAVSRSAAVTGRKKATTTAVKDVVEDSHCTQSILSLCPLPPMVGEPPFPKISGPVVGNATLTLARRRNDIHHSMERSEVEGITLGTDLPREQPEAVPSGLHPTSSTCCFQGNGSFDCVPSQPSTVGKELRENHNVFQEAASDAMQPNQEQFYIKNKQTIDGQHIASDVSIGEVVEHPVEPTRPIMEPAPRKETATIDLTRDDSLTEWNIELHKTSTDPAHPKAGIQMKLGVPNISDGMSTEESTFVSSPRIRHRSVTFASPIEYVLNKKLQSETQVNSSSAARSRQPPSPSESSTLSPIRIPTRTVNMRRESPRRITPHATLQKSKISHAPLYDQTADEVGIQDIVDVLNEIQAVIIQGISDKFRNVKKDVQRGRDELTQQVLDELRVMVAENARHFNGLLRLEEDYYKICKAIVRCWEELIDCNDGIAVQFQNALKEHDQSISARTFPKSLLPMQPVFTRRRANA